MYGWTDENTFEAYMYAILRLMFSTIPPIKFEDRMIATSRSFGPHC